MNKSFPIHNLIRNSEPVRSKNQTVLYNKHNTLFDLCMSACSYVTIMEHIQNQETYFNTYDTFCTNNLIDHSRNVDLAKAYHLIDVVFCHEALPDVFKKEDRFLLFNTLTNSRIIATTPSAAKYLANYQQNAESIEYGIPEIPLSRQKRKPILLFTLNNNNQTNNLYNHIKQHIPDCEMINRLPAGVNIIQILAKLNEYSILIDLDAHINNLCGVMSGCVCITNLDTDYPNSIRISNFQNIIEVIKKQLLEYDIDRVSSNIESIKSKYLC